MPPWPTPPKWGRPGGAGTPAASRGESFWEIFSPISWKNLLVTTGQIYRLKHTQELLHFHKKMDLFPERIWHPKTRRLENEDNSRYPSKLGIVHLQRKCRWKTSCLWPPNGTQKLLLPRASMFLRKSTRSWTGQIIESVLPNPGDIETVLKNQTFPTFSMATWRGTSSDFSWWTKLPSPGTSFGILPKVLDTFPGRRCHPLQPSWTASLPPPSFWFGAPDDEIWISQTMKDWPEQLAGWHWVHHISQFWSIGNKSYIEPAYPSFFRPGFPLLNGPHWNRQYFLWRGVQSEKGHQLSSASGQPFQYLRPQHAEETSEGQSLNPEI